VDFLRKTRAFPIPHLETVCMQHEESPCMIPAVKGSGTPPLSLSAIQFKRGLAKGAPTFLAALKFEDSEDLRKKQGVPRELETVLREFSDVMSKELPPGLPPKITVDHKIELQQDAKPPARGPYRMAPPELAELRKQLQE